MFVNLVTVQFALHIAININKTNSTLHVYVFIHTVLQTMFTS